MRSVSRALGAVVVAAALATTAVLGSSRLNGHAQASLVNNFPGHYYAPYVDLTASPTQSLVADSRNGGIEFYSLAFITADESTPCEAAWGSAVPLSQLSTFLPNLDSDIRSLRSQGGDVIVSFGGEAGTELAQSCTSESGLQAQYQSIIDHYQVSHLDFDIEGPAVTDSASIDLRNRTLAALEAANPGLVVSYTLPVLPTGLVTSGIDLLQNAIADGVNVSVVDVMAMDYGSSFPPDKMGQNAIDASNSLISQLKSLYPSKSDAQIRAMVGVTPMSGANDVAPENFTLADAQQLLGYARSAGITELAMWSVNRDASAFSYSKVFDQFNSSSPAPTPTPTGTPRPTPTPTATPTPSPTPTPTPAPTPTLTPPPPTPTPATGNLLASPGFESGSLSPWSCSPLDSVVAGPVHSGSHALAAAANNSDNAQCTQTIAVQPNHSYTLTGWVQGTYAFIGVTGTGTSDTSNFTPSSATYTQLSVPFTTGASTTSVTVYVHGWYAQGTIFADDFSVS
ncbi:MAG TPA: carbohydrate binding domain-containing protein [Terriglobales bacterium]|nr:carbohydrate binding domain-containing protein [Terriglobales bacterium]